MRLFIKDPKTKEPSVTITLLVVGFSAAVIKLLLAGNIIHGFTFGAFTGADFASVIASLGAIYGWRKYTDKDPNDKKLE